ncbi:MAG: DUF2157 domain-containing protein [Caldilineaceae bacterium]
MADQLYKLAAAGYLNRQALAHGLRLVEHVPGRQAWRRFLDRLLLIVGVLLLVSGVFFFFAYNWDALHRFVRLGLVEAAILAAAALAHFLGLRKLSGKVALLAAALLGGALLAVFGQEYQTGADSYTLFLTWMLLIAGWVAISAFAPLWLLWLALANIALVLYWSQVLTQDYTLQLEALFLLDAVALALWEAARLRGVSWLQPRWYARVVAVAALGWSTAAVLKLIVDWSSFAADIGRTDWTAPVLYALFLAGMLFVYQRYIRDLFVLTGAAVSVIAVITTFVAQQADLSDVTLYFVLGALLIGQAALAVTWLLRVQRGWEQVGEV